MECKMAIGLRGIKGGFNVQNRRNIKHFPRLLAVSTSPTMSMAMLMKMTMTTMLMKYTRPGNHLLTASLCN